MSRETDNTMGSAVRKFGDKAVETAGETTMTDAASVTATGSDPAPAASDGPDVAPATASPETVCCDAQAPDAVAAARNKHAETVITNNLYLSLVAGVIPVAFVDTAALVGVQIKLLKELADVYEVEFRGDLGKSAVGVLLGSVTPTVLAQGVIGSSLMGSLVSSVPVIGPTLKVLTMPAFGAAFTYAVGKVFQQHFASGGTFLTFDPARVQTFFRETFEQAKKHKLLNRRKKAAPVQVEPLPVDAVPA